MYYNKVTFGFIAFIFFIGCDFRSSEDLLHQAEKLELNGQYQEAIAFLDKAIEKNPEYLGAYINRGADRSALGDHKGAIKDYQRVLEFDTNNTLALFNIANNFYCIGDYSTSVNYYNRAMGSKGGEQFYMDFVPNDFVDLSAFDVPGIEIMYLRGLAYYELDSLRLSSEDMLKCIQKSYMIKESYYMIGACYFKGGQLDQACKEFQIAADLGDKDALEMIKNKCNHLNPDNSAVLEVNGYSSESN